MNRSINVCYHCEHRKVNGKLCYDSEQYADSQEFDLRLPSLRSRLGEANPGQACAVSQVQIALLGYQAGRTEDGKASEVAKGAQSETRQVSQKGNDPITVPVDLVIESEPRQSQTMKTLRLIVLCSFAVLAADKNAGWETAKVSDQKIDSVRVGTSVSGGGILRPLSSKPVYEKRNHLTLVTARYTFELQAQGKDGIVLAVGDDVQFSRDGNVVTVLDSKEKKHKFDLVGMHVNDSSSAQSGGK